MIGDDCKRLAYLRKIASRRFLGRNDRATLFWAVHEIRFLFALEWSLDCQKRLRKVILLGPPIQQFRLTDLLRERELARAELAAAEGERQM